MKRYVPSGNTEEGAQLALVVTVLAVALVVGGLANLIGQFIRLLILFPAAMGGLVGASALMLAMNKKMRAPLFVSLVAAGGGLLCWFTDFGIDYLRTRGAFAEQVEQVAQQLESQGLGTPDEDDRSRTVDVLLQYWGQQRQWDDLVIAVNLLNEPLSDAAGNTRQPDPDPSAWQAFAYHVQGLANEGTTISDVGRSDGDNIGAVGTWLLWAFELLICVGVAGGIGWEQARQPFCERCKQWYGRAERLVAVAPASAGEAVVRALEQGGTEGLAAAWAPFDVGKPFIALGIRACPKCSSGDCHVDVVKLSPKKNKTNRKSLRRGLVSAGKLDDQLKALGEKAKRAAEKATPRNITP
jgi:hypothetical protein